MTYQLDLHHAREHSLAQKHTALFNACETLRLHDKALYDLATQEARGSASATVPVMQGKEKYERLFPREMRLPTDTPGKGGWDYGWVYVPEEKALEKISFKTLKEDKKTVVLDGAPGGEGADGAVTETKL